MEVMAIGGEATILVVLCVGFLGFEDGSRGFVGWYAL